MTVVTDDRLLFGEAVEEDDFLCDTHGCRLSMLNGTLYCPECILEDRQREREECMMHNQEHMEDVAHSTCRIIVGEGFVGFQCTMPWWA